MPSFRTNYSWNEYIVWQVSWIHSRGKWKIRTISISAQSFWGKSRLSSANIIASNRAAFWRLSHWRDICCFLHSSTRTSFVVGFYYSAVNRTPPWRSIANFILEEACHEVWRRFYFLGANVVLLKLDRRRFWVLQTCFARYFLFQH